MSQRMVFLFGIVLALAAGFAIFLYQAGKDSQSTASTSERSDISALAARIPGLVWHDVPRPLPDEVTLEAPAGRSRPLAALTGRWRLVNFWATWCAPCVEEIPTLERLQLATGGPGFEVLLVSLDMGGVKEAAPALARMGGAHLVTFADPGMEAMGALGITSLPTTLLIDPQGRERARMVGPAEWDSPPVLSLVRALAATSAVGGAKAAS